MADIEINDLAMFGCIRDVEPYQLPPEAWSQAENMRFFSEGVERIGGREQVFGTPGVAPHFAIPVASASQTFWLYTSLAKAYVFDGSSHTNITRQTLGVDVDYTASNTREWNGTLLGGVPILNNGVDLPQYWSALSVGTKLSALANWPTDTTARVIRAFGPHLMAFDLTVNGTRFPHMVRWSHPADPGSVPASWDVDDPTRDAGQSDLPDVNAGIILDALPLRGSMYIYKEASTWRANFVGGQSIFKFDTFLESSGIIAPRCVTITADGLRHVVATQDDIIVHNGQSMESILDKRYRKFYNDNIDSSNYLNCFMFTNPIFNEVWFCFPEDGQTQATRALIWSYKEGKFGAISEAPINFRNAASGVIETASSDLWSTVSSTWVTAEGPWSQSIRRKVVLCGTDATKFYLLDSGTTNDGVAINGTLQREGLALIGRKRNGEWIVDFQRQKIVRRVWIKASGGPFNVRVGFQSTVDGNVSWSALTSFDPSTQKWVDIVGSGVAVSVEFSGSVPFRVAGYKMEGELGGRF